jgi:hypothetical protein
MYPLQPISPRRPSASSTALYPSMELCHLWYSAPFTASVPCTGLCPLLIPLSPVRSYVPSMASVSSTTFYSLYHPLFPLRPSAPSTALYPFYSSLFPQQPSVPSTASVSFVALCPSMTVCPLHCPTPSLQPFITCMAICVPYRPLPLYGSLSPLWPSAPSTTVCPLYSSRSSPQPPVLSSALCPLYGLSSVCGRLFPLRPSSFSTALCSLYGFLFSIWPFVSLTALCFL